MTDTIETKNREARNNEAGDGEVKTSNMETHSALPPEETERLATEIVAALKTVFDPELQALQRAKGVQKTLDAEQKRNNQAIDDAEKGDDKDKDGGP